MAITRFNPTTNGNLHLGHIYTLLVNEWMAKSSRGKFYVRFDDTSQAITIEMKNKDRLQQIINNQTNDITWLGVEVDGWSKQSDLLAEVHEKMNPRYVILPDPYPHMMPTVIKMIGTGWIPYPYAPYQTAERVVMDHMLGITHVIRGEDFLTEYSLYRYFCEQFNYPTPDFIYLPRLTGRHGDISKTCGGYTITELRGEGYTAMEIRSLLAKACLNWYGNDWDIYNLKREPYIDL